MSKKKTKTCSQCGEERDLARDFYQSNSNKNADGKVSLCKQCITSELRIDKETDLLSEAFLKRIQDVLLELNLPYIHDIWVDTVEDERIQNSGKFGTYLRRLHLNHKNVDWRDSVFADEDSDDVEEKTVSNEKADKKEVESKHNVELDTQNEKDVLRLLGYDPFEHEHKDDRANLFNELIDYLDESTLEDGFKLSSVITIVKTWNQVNKIDTAISNNMSNMKNFSKNSGNISSLIKAKNSMVKVANDLAKENGISVRNATNKSKGAGTLSGILKQLRDFDFEEAEVNLFDIESAEGIRQVADISNSNIMKQLRFDENDYTEMLNEQRALLETYERKAKEFEENNRLLRIELDKRIKKEKELEEKIVELKTKKIG